MAYDAVGSDVDAEGDEESADEVLAETPAAGANGEDEEEDEEDSDPDVELDSDEEEDDDVNEKPLVRSSARTRKRAKDVESDTEEPASDAEESSAAEDDDSDKVSSDAESVVAERWEAITEGASSASVEVANRNNCVYVCRENMSIFSLQLIETDFAVTMKKMIPVKISKNTWLALFAEIIVSDQERCIFRKS